MWMKYGALWAYCWGLALADFGRILRSSNSLRGSRIFHLNNARFHWFSVGNISRNLNTTPSIGEAVKTSGTEFWKFYHKGLFFQKLLTKFIGLATSVRHNSAMITDRTKLTTKIALYAMSSFHYYRENQFKFIFLGCTPRTGNVLTNFSIL